MLYGARVGAEPVCGDIVATVEEPAVRAYEWACGTWNCGGVIRTPKARPVDDELVRCQPREGRDYGSSCHSEQRFDAGLEQFMVCLPPIESDTVEYGELPY